MSRTQVLLTKIAKLCLEVRAIKGANKINNIPKRSKSRNSHKPESQDIHGEDDLHAHAPQHNTPSHQEHLSDSTYKPPDDDRTPSQTLSTRTPERVSPSRSSSPDPPESTEVSSSLDVLGSREGMSGSTDKDSIGAVTYSSSERRTETLLG